MKNNWDGRRAEAPASRGEPEWRSRRPAKESIDQNSTSGLWQEAVVEEPPKERNDQKSILVPSEQKRRISSLTLFIGVGMSIGVVVLAALMGVGNSFFGPSLTSFSIMMSPFCFIMARLVAKQNVKKAVERGGRANSDRPISGKSA
jgi:hypothetical protein